MEQGCFHVLYNVDDGFIVHSRTLEWHHHIFLCDVSTEDCGVVCCITHKNKYVDFR